MIESSFFQLRYLLLQIRNVNDPMRGQEVRCFARALDCDRQRIGTFDLINESLTERRLKSVDAILIGGSGDYSVTLNQPWLERALDGLRLLYQSEKPTFASCWGFQALAKALGGNVVKDASRAEVGTLTASLTLAGRTDPVFGALPETFATQMGHEDCVTHLPEKAILLVSTQRVENQAMTFADRPIYATQFHPELNVAAFLERVKAYPQYVTELTGLSYERFKKTCQDTPEASQLLPRFVQHVFGGS